jgi:hypothetical protein
LGHPISAAVLHYFGWARICSRALRHVHRSGPERAYLRWLSDHAIQWRSPIKDFDNFLLRSRVIFHRYVSAPASKGMQTSGNDEDKKLQRRLNYPTKNIQKILSMKLVDPDTLVCHRKTDQNRVLTSRSARTRRPPGMSVIPFRAWCPFRSRWRKCFL